MTPELRQLLAEILDALENTGAYPDLCRRIRDLLDEPSEFISYGEMPY